MPLNLSLYDSSECPTLNVLAVPEAAQQGRKPSRRSLVRQVGPAFVFLTLLPRTDGRLVLTARCPQRHGTAEGKFDSYALQACLTLSSATKQCLNLRCVCVSLLAGRNGWAVTEFAQDLMFVAQAPVWQAERVLGPDSTLHASPTAVSGHSGVLGRLAPAAAVPAAASIILSFILGVVGHPRTSTCR